MPAVASLVRQPCRFACKIEICFYFEAFFLQTSDQHELDLVLDFGKRVWAIEVKLTASPDAGDLARLNKTVDLTKADKRVLISQTSESISRAGQISCNLPWFIAHARDL